LADHGSSEYDNLDETVSKFVENAWSKGIDGVARIGEEISCRKAAVRSQNPVNECNGDFSTVIETRKP